MLIPLHSSCCFQILLLPILLLLVTSCDCFVQDEIYYPAAVRLKQPVRPTEEEKERRELLGFVCPFLFPLRDKLTTLTRDKNLVSSSQLLFVNIFGQS